MEKFRNSNGFRIVVLGVLLLGFLIPLSFVNSLVDERMNTFYSAIEEVSSKWGGNQTIRGPIIAIPYSITTRKYLDSEMKKFEWETRNYEMLFLPEELNVTSKLNPIIRNRGIYKIMLYNNLISLNGKFKPISEKDFPTDANVIHWDSAKIILGMDDPKGITSELIIQCNNHKLNFSPGTDSEILNKGIHAKLTTKTNNSDDGITKNRLSGYTNFLSKGNLSFEMDFHLKGSSIFRVVPVGKSSKLSMDSTWADPSFIGAILPTDRVVNDKGFNATWETSFLSRNYGQKIDSRAGFNEQEMNESSFGVNLIIPSDHYQFVDRSLKYAILILLMSFTIFFLIEILTKLQLHPIQYLLIGAAKIIFYILNLALSEHLGFAMAYWIASISVAILIGYYAGNILKSRVRGFYTTGFFLLLYSFLFVILSAEDYALIIGSICLFALLGIVMHVTRKMNWYNSPMPTKD
ncbi:cell envelope integrity protein CreD [Leptospira sp. GIMC2001]|uniref:cell envelope integrity protein CreD n=1 Tax=Leptospira sp. GIMC2001 TaxID=1513297 RepID=UPI00234B2434|nr:cell envelope integrity protein CreD [Leptospira sp. GIMC2001]WCL48690.1 cell envelope integrity protein CreD [Leptospira sp. GIMC2001]